MLLITALLVAYAVIALYVAHDRLQIGLFGIPVVLLGVIAAVPALNAPYANTVAVAVSYVLVAMMNAVPPTLTVLGLEVVQFVAVIMLGLLLSEMRATFSKSRTGESDGLLAKGEARQIVARELRRSRRTGAPVSLLLLESNAALEPSKRHELIRSLEGGGREFDTVLATSANELGILCVGTDRAGARLYADRLASSLSLKGLSMASFPDDAVTSQGLFDAARRRPVERVSLRETVVTVE